MSRCRAMIEVSEAFVNGICMAQLNRTERDTGPELQTRKSDEKGYILVRCGREEGACTDKWGHLIWLFDQPCCGEPHSYLEED